MKEVDMLSFQTSLEVERELRRRIRGARYAAGAKMPSERELTDEFGCSRGTVSKALSALSDEGLVERVHGAGTFVAEGFEAALERGEGARGGVVTYLSPKGDSRVSGSRNLVLEGMHEALDGAQFHVGIDFYSGAGECAGCLKKLQGANIAGLVLWPEPGAGVAREVKRLAASGVPVVMIDTHLPEVECDFVVSDNIGGAAEMVLHLAAQGHREICYFTGEPDRSSLVDRMAGFLKGMVMAGLPFSAENVIQADGDLRGVLRSVLHRKRRPSAIFASHDMRAIELMNALQAEGVRVPQDMSVAGFDGVEFGAMAQPALTTMAQDFKGMAVKASQILLERIDKRAENLFYRLYVEPKLVLRKSSKKVM